MKSTKMLKPLVVEEHFTINTHENDYANKLGIKTR